MTDAPRVLIADLLIDSTSFATRRAIVVASSNAIRPPCGELPEETSLNPL